MNILKKMCLHKNFHEMFGLAKITRCLGPQLAAGGRNILPFTAPDNDRIVFLQQNLLEFLDDGFWRPLLLAAIVAIERN